MPKKSLNDRVKEQVEKATGKKVGDLLAELPASLQVSKRVIEPSSDQPLSLKPTHSYSQKKIANRGQSNRKIRTGKTSG